MKKLFFELILFVCVVGLSAFAAEYICSEDVAITKDIIISQKLMKIIVASVVIAAWLRSKKYICT